MRVEEATAKTETLRQSNLKTSLSGKMAEIITKKPSVDPKQLRSRIVDEIKVNVNPMSILKRNDNNKNTKNSSKIEASKATSDKKLRGKTSLLLLKKYKLKKPRAFTKNSVETAQLSSS